MTADTATLRFKFRLIHNGMTVGFLAMKGMAGARGLLLDDTILPMEQIGETVSRDNRVLIEVRDPTALSGTAALYARESGGTLIVEVYRVTADALERFIDRHCAALAMAARRAEAREQGLEHQLRSAECPTCESEIDLSELPESPYVYCPFCDTIFDAVARTSAGRAYRTCDECGYFGRVQSYTEFYFYFLLIVYGFSYKKRFLCDECAHRLFVVASLLNALFVLGLPSALWVKIKSLMGRQEGMATLAAGNRAAKRGDLDGAARAYESVRTSFPEHPGVLMNEALTHIGRGSRSHGAALLDRALEACPNYRPLIRLMDAPARSPAG